MTVRALLTAPPAGDPFARVAGLSVLLRQLLSLQDAGCQEILVQGIPQGELPVDARLTATVVSIAPTEPVPAVELSARLGLVWHRALPKRLLQRGYRGDLETAPHSPDEFMVAATDGAARRQAESQLLAALLKATDGIISRNINRPISLRITRLLLDTSLTPNQMTGVAALFGIAAILVVALGGVPWLIPGALLLQAQSILDGCDGEISRLKYIRSRLGEWLDQVLDDIVNLGFFAATSWVLWQAGSTVALVLGVIGVVIHIVYQISLYAALILRGGGSGSVNSIQWRSTMPVTGVPKPRNRFDAIKLSVEIAGRRDFFTFFYLPMAIIGLPELALAWCAIVWTVSAVAIVVEWIVYGGPTPVRTAGENSG